MYTPPQSLVTNKSNRRGEVVAPESLVAQKQAQTGRPFPKRFKGNSGPMKGSALKKRPIPNPDISTIANPPPPMTHFNVPGRVTSNV